MNYYQFGGNSPPVSYYIAQSPTSFLTQLTTKAQEGVTWGITVGTGIMGMMLIAAVLRTLIDKA